jgi:hypothetical protein
MTDKYRECQFDLYYSRDEPARYKGNFREGWFHEWTGTSEWPWAIVEDATGKIYLIGMEGIRFTERPE